jgi:hypothetical protein
MNGNNPLGNFSSLVAAIISVMIVGAWITAEMLKLTGVAVIQGDGNLFAASTAILGYVFGARASMNGASIVANAAHTRLDKLGAPPANG